MPGNIVMINNSKDLEWYVGDSKMPMVIKTLNKLGFKKSTKRRAVKCLSIL